MNEHQKKTLSQYFATVRGGGYLCRKCNAAFDADTSLGELFAHVNAHFTAERPAVAKAYLTYNPITTSVSPEFVKEIMTEEPKKLRSKSYGDWRDDYPNLFPPEEASW